MRIIAGTHRGRILAAPKGLATRPMLGRVREAIFNRLAPWTENALVLDLFSGTGSLGLEALSRGAKFVRFLERDHEARTALKLNLKNLELDEMAEARNGDALNAANHIATADGPWDIVFFDRRIRSSTLARVATSSSNACVRSSWASLPRTACLSTTRPQPLNRRKTSARVSKRLSGRGGPRTFGFWGERRTTRSAARRAAPF